MDNLAFDAPCGPTVTRVEDGGPTPTQEDIQAISKLTSTMIEALRLAGGEVSLSDDLSYDSTSTKVRGKRLLRKSLFILEGPCRWLQLLSRPGKWYNIQR